jgi:hypothetical protein
MSTLSLRLPPSIHRYVGELARREGVSLNHFITTAVAEKISALTTEEYLEKRGARASRKAFVRVLGKVPPSEPAAEDRLPSGVGHRRVKVKRTSGSS